MHIYKVGDRVRRSAALIPPDGRVKPGESGTVINVFEAFSVNVRWDEGGDTIPYGNEWLARLEPVVQVVANEWLDRYEVE